MNRMSDCIFCKIVARDIPAKVLYEDDSLLAFHDAFPKAPTHFLVVPKRHIATLDDCTAADEAVLGQMVLTAKRLAKELGLSSSGYRLVMNVHEGAGQSVFHIHLHGLGGREMAWPPG